MAGYAGRCVGGPWDGRDYAPRDPGALALMGIPGAKLVEHRPDGKTDEHVYRWGDGKWLYQYSDCEL